MGPGEEATWELMIMMRELVIGRDIAQLLTRYGGEWENVGVFSVLVLILVFRPTGLLGEETPER